VPTEPCQARPCSSVSLQRHHGHYRNNNPTDHPVCCCCPPFREKLYQAALAVLPIDQLPTEERTVAAAHVDGRDLPKAGALGVWRGVWWHVAAHIQH
jgi:hypothetical protein